MFCFMRVLTLSCKWHVILEMNITLSQESRNARRRPRNADDQEETKGKHVHSVVTRQGEPHAVNLLDDDDTLVFTLLLIALPRASPVGRGHRSLHSFSHYYNSLLRPISREEVQLVKDMSTFLGDRGTFSSLFAYWAVWGASCVKSRSVVRNLAR